MFSRIFEFWIDGLAAAFLRVAGIFRRRGRFELRANAENLTLHAVDAQDRHALFSINPSQIEQIPPDIRQRVRGGTIEIVVPDAAIMERQLEPLPAESRPYLENVVLHQIDAIFPWRSAEILHSILINKRGDGRLDVLVRATPRPAIAAALAAAAACGASEALVVSDKKDAGGERRAGIAVSLGSDTEARLSQAKQVARWAVAAAVLIFVLTLGWTSFSEWTLSNDIASLDQAIADRRAILRRNVATNTASPNQSLEARKRQDPLAVVTFEKLSSLLPDTTYLTDLALEGEHLRITGMSSDAAALVPLLEGSGYFKGASFYAPTTRVSGTAADRFSIEASLAASKKAAP